jgi:hypothetical protein
MMMNQLLQSIATNNNGNNANEQSPSFLSLLEAYQREKQMNDMIVQKLLSSSLQQPSQQSAQQNHQQQANGPNYATLLAAANGQNGLNQQQQLLQQTLFGLPMNSIPALFPSANTATDNALLAFLQANNNNNNGSNTPSELSQAHKQSSLLNTHAPAPLVADSKLMLSPKDTKIDLTASALNGSFKAPSSFLPNLKEPASDPSGLSNQTTDVSTLDTAALLTLLTSGKTAPAPKMVEAPAPMSSSLAGLSSPAPANPADAALLAMIQQVQQQRSASSTRASSPVLNKASTNPKTSLDAARAAASLLTPISPLRRDSNNVSSNPATSLAMAVEIAASKSKAQAKASINKTGPSVSQTAGSIASFIEPQNDDVLFGKGRTKHQGNRHLQKLIENLMAVYEAATKQQKKELADMVVTKILNSGGRFLKLDEDSQQWDEVEREDAHKKVAHAFRNLRRRNK